MTHPEQQYLEMLCRIVAEGDERMDRTGTGTIALFGQQMRFDLSKGFPAVTTKKLAWKACVSELLWFIEGSGDEKRLKEILHGDRHTDKQTIWTGNAEATYWKPKAKREGDLGRVYGVQWRDWQSPVVTDTDVLLRHTDQLLQLVDGIKKDPYGRRHILTAWNPGELSQMALPPCHMFAQFFVSKGKLSCQMYQRSADMFLGVPFNIASYSLFTHMLAQVCDLQVGEFVHILGDTHIYSNHVEQVKEQVSREPLPLPTLWLNPEIKDITKFTMNDIRLDGYQHHPPIKADMAV
jgi:thymidylate synthase